MKMTFQRSNLKETNKYRHVRFLKWKKAEHILNIQYRRDEKGTSIVTGWKVWSTNVFISIYKNWNPAAN